jgi:thimet oligopeptidase
VEPPFWPAGETVGSFTARQDEGLARAATFVDTVRSEHGTRSVENTLVPFDHALFELESAESQSSLIENVHPDAALRAAAEQCSQKASAARTALLLDRAVYDALAAVPLADADAATRHYLERTLRDFRRAGVDKDETTAVRIRALNLELVELGQHFLRNIRDDTRFVRVKDPGELAGLPADYIERHPPDDSGVISLSTDYPDALPIFSYARSATLRRSMYREYNSRGYPKNLEVLERMLDRRHELANLLGYPTWADYITADKMVSSARAASDFIDRVVEASGARARREYESLLAHKRRTFPDAEAVEAWEAPYWSEQLRQAEYAFDSQSVRPYLSFARVKPGLFDVVCRLFGVELRPVPDAPVWHPSVECWEMREGGVVRGRFYLDLFPRPNKYSHAAHFGIRPGVREAHVPEAALVCNFPGGGGEGDPGLMDHSEVRTFFHEFGHLLHSLFAGHQRWAGIAGIATERDFVEAPSQMFEEWTWSPAVLSTFARHYETGQPMPAALVDQMKRASELPKGLNVRRQMVLARTSLAYHDRPSDEVDVDILYRQIAEQYLPYAAVKRTHFPCSFGHLDGYSAVYYTYMWSLVISKDLFSAFDSRNLLDPATARRYRDQVLAPGGSAPAAALLEAFLGRPFRYDAWEQWLREP